MILSPFPSVRRVLAAAAAVLPLALAALPSAAQVRVLVNPGDQGEQSRHAGYEMWRGLLDQALRREKASGVAFAMSTNATEDLGATRSRIPDVVVGPAHVIGSAVRYGYTPVLGLEKALQAVLVAQADQPIDSLAKAAGKKLGLPQQDSVVTYLVRGELNAANTTFKRHFASVYQTGYQEALLVCLQVRRCDVVAVERAVYERWVAAGHKLRVVLASRSVPGLSVAIKPGSKPGAEALRAALAESAPAAAPRAEDTRMGARTAQDFEYVSTLGYFTPRELPGATVVDAAAVVAGMQRGARYIDTRNAAEFKEGHVPGAVLVPYVEKSAKEPDFNPAEDQFDVARLGADRQAPLIFGCNGPECWKSFKASQAAVKAGYTQVRWFRGGFPEWRAAGLKTDTLAP
ncbi:MAG: hypothetical protein JWQ03_2819 [Variovorax sp.]|nr:hypothetical protein [Variovorax sp.]